MAENTRRKDKLGLKGFKGYYYKTKNNKCLQEKALSVKVTFLLQSMYLELI